MPHRVHKLDNQLSRLFDELKEKEGMIVSREHLIHEIWYGNEYVGRSALTKNIWRLRKALKANENLSNYDIETIPKRGYRLVLRRNKTFSRILTSSSRVSNIALLLLSFLFIFLFLYAATTENVDVIRPPDNMDKFSNDIGTSKLE